MANPYSTGPASTESMVGMRSSSMQQMYASNVNQYMQGDASQSHYQSVHQSQNQSMMPHNSGPLPRHTELKKEERVYRPLNPPPYAPEVLDDLSRYSVYTLSVIGRELVHELLWRHSSLTSTLMTVLFKHFERRSQQQGTADPEPLLDYCYLLLAKIAEVALRIEQVGPSNKISEDDFLAMMSQPGIPEATSEEVRKNEIFEAQRQKLVKLNTALKKFEWMAMVSDPRFLKS